MTSHPFDLTGKLAVVTGASRGIGLAIATAYADAGADVVGVSTNLPAGDSEVRRAVEDRGREFTAIATDFADGAAVAPSPAHRRRSTLTRSGTACCR